MNSCADGNADRNKKRHRSGRNTQPDSVGVHHGGFWSRRPRFESESGYSHLYVKKGVAGIFALKKTHMQHMRTTARTLE